MKLIKNHNVFLKQYMLKLRYDALFVSIKEINKNKTEKLKKMQFIYS